jgi:selenocysteine lyase/cysteine desulfurase
VPYNDELGIRISAQIYNEPQDYERLLVALKSHFDL